jgi:hypothetical protein
VISQEIALDKLIDDIDVQIEVLTAISDDNAILSEQLRLLHESREQLLSQNLEISRLSELIDPDHIHDHTTQFEHQIEQQPEQNFDERFDERFEESFEESFEEPLKNQEHPLQSNPNAQE